MTDRRDSASAKLSRAEAMSSSSQREDQPPSTDGDAQSSQGDDQPPSTDDDAQSSQGDDQSPSADGAQSSSSSQGDDLFPPILDDADDAVIADTWQVYKHATPIKSGTGEEVFDFVTKYICPSMGAPSEIGCGGLKVGCTVYSATGCDETRNYDRNGHSRREQWPRGDGSSSWSGRRATPLLCRHHTARVRVPNTNGERNTQRQRSDGRWGRITGTTRWSCTGSTR